MKKGLLPHRRFKYLRLMLYKFAACCDSGNCFSSFIFALGPYSSGPEAQLDNFIDVAPDDIPLILNLCIYLQGPVTNQ